MTIIRQMSLFGIQELYEMEPTHRYDAIISVINLDKIYHTIKKQSPLGAPQDLNYAAMIISTFIRYVERIPTVKDLVKRLNEDIAFKLDCGFLVSNAVPSEASYSRLSTKLSESDMLEEVQETIVTQAIAEGFIMDVTIAIDATHFEARDQAPAKEDKEKPEPKNADGNPKKNVKPGCRQKLKRKLLCLSTKKRLKRSWMSC